MSTYSTVTTSTLDNMLSTYYDKNLLKRIEARQRYAQFAEERPLPKGEGKSVVFNGWENLTAVSSTLTEATTPTAENLSSRKVTATVYQYGKLVKVSDFVDLTAISSPVKGALETLGYWGAQTVDRVCQRAVFKDQLSDRGKSSIVSAWASSVASAYSDNTGTSNTSDAQLGFPVVLATSASRLSATDGSSASTNASVTAVNKAVAELEALDAPKLDDGYYVGICHPKFKDDLYNDSRWEDIHKYVSTKGGGVETIYKGEIGRINGVRFVMTSEQPWYYSETTSKSSDLTFIFGKGAYGITKLDGGVSTYRVTKPDHTNPLAQYKQIGVKLNAAAATLNPSCGRILITTRP